MEGTFPEFAEQITLKRLRAVGRLAEYHFLPLTTSTNDVARTLARQGVGEISVVVADQQSAGRGRRGKDWVSLPGGGLWASFLLRPLTDSRESGLLGLMAAQAVFETLTITYGLGEVSVKWPNDVLIGGKKVAGVLVETGANGERIQWAAVGIGINTAKGIEMNPELAFPATSLEFEMGKPMDRGELLVNLFSCLCRSYDNLKNDKTAFLRRFTAICGTIGRNVVGVSATGEFSGRAVGLDSTGALLIESPTLGRVRATSGEISVREVARKSLAMDS